MEPKLNPFSTRYLRGLRVHLRQPSGARPQTALGLGRRAVEAGLETLDVARIHEQAIRFVLSGQRAARPEAIILREAGVFFAGVITPIEASHRGAQQAQQLSQLVQELHQRSLDLALSSRRLEEERARRVAVEEALHKSEQHYNKSMEQSRDLQEQLRYLSHQILSVQEEERKRISRELHDQIVQTLTGINLRLANLKGEARVNAKDLQKKIASTQRMVEKSVEVVHRFARDLRPTVLDDLGLIPALHSFMKDFTKRTGIRIEFTACRSDLLDALDGSRRTVLYRVAQEALTNVARHAHASRVQVSLQKVSGAIHMKIADDGKGFPVERAWLPKPHKRLGVLGMRERVQMVGGQFTIESAPRQGTSIHAALPLDNGSAGRENGR